MTETQTGVKVVPVLGDAVTGEFYTFSTYGREQLAKALAHQIAEEVGREDDFMEGYSESLSFTVNLTFNFGNEVPDHIRFFEKWWSMVQGKRPVGECYLFLVENIGTQAVNAWRLASIRAIQNWVPPEQRMEENLSEKEAADPKS